MLTLVMSPHQHKHQGCQLPSQYPTENVSPTPSHVDDSIYCLSGAILVCGKRQGSGVCWDGGGCAGGCPDPRCAGLRAEQGLAGNLVKIELSRLEHQSAGVRIF